MGPSGTLSLSDMGKSCRYMEGSLPRPDVPQFPCQCHVVRTDVKLPERPPRPPAQSQPPAPAQAVSPLRAALSCTARSTSVAWSLRRYGLNDRLYPG
ncbi:hypothetical protein XENTR_v10016092 [Xenopus tropicalis]|nr:hypothetical protein XENTR_v10016092 [Xenopus tropicalis]